MCLATVLSSVAQDSSGFKRIEDQLNYHLSRIQYWSGHREYSDAVDTYDSIDVENKIFIRELVAILNRYPATLQYDFPALKKNGLTIANSIDGSLRFYSWDDQMGGTMRYYNSVAQFQTSRGIDTRIVNNTTEDGRSDEGVNVQRYDDIHVVNRGPKPLYLGIRGAQLQGYDRVRTVEAITINDSELVFGAKMFKTEQGFRGSLSFEYPGCTDSEPCPDIFYIRDRQALYFPIVNWTWSSDSTFHFSKQYTIYQFNGRYFEAKGTWQEK